MSSEYSVDQLSFDLADYFLCDEYLDYLEEFESLALSQDAREFHKWELAQQIQDCVESYCDFDLRVAGKVEKEGVTDKPSSDGECYFTKLKRDSYSSDDYAGIKGGDHSFYYGYEQTNDNGDWLFVGKASGDVVKVWTAAELGSEQFDNPSDVLMKGVAKYLEEYL